MSEPQVPAAEEYRKAFQQYVALSKLRNEAMIMMITSARMQADLLSLHQESAPRDSPFQRLSRYLADCWRARKQAAIAKSKHDEFPWNTHAYYVVNDADTVQEIVDEHTGKECDNHDQARSVPAEPDPDPSP